MSRWPDGPRLAVGTLTVLPTRPPRDVGPQVARAAMVLAPAVGAVIALVAGLWLWLLGGVAGHPGPVVAGLRAVGLEAVVPPLLTAALVVGMLALLTRAMHLDGLADTADGLGSGRPPEQALAVMRRGDVGPFGVVTLVLVLLVEVTALAHLLASGTALAALGVALVASRALLPLLCRVGVPGARPEGLGVTVAGTVSQGWLAVSMLLAVVLAAGLSVVGGLVEASPGWPAFALGVVGAAVAGVWTGRSAVRRLGGVTGDVLGAAVEAAFAGSLVLMAVA